MFEAITSNRSPSGIYIIGVVRRSPLLAPLVVSKSKGLPLNASAVRFARNSSISWRLWSFCFVIIPPAVDADRISNSLEVEDVSFFRFRLAHLFDSVNGSFSPEKIVSGHGRSWRGRRGATFCF